MLCEKQRQDQQDKHEERYGEEAWIPPGQELYRQAVAHIGDVLHGIQWPIVPPEGEIDRT